MTQVKELPHVLDPEIVKRALIEKTEYDLALAQLEVEKIKKFLAYLKNNNAAETVNLKWRAEIRSCMATRSLSTATTIADCVAYTNNIQADRNIKLKISSTLNLMFNEGEIGRIIMDGERDYRYGLKDYFKADTDNKLTILKEEILNNIEESRGISLAPTGNEVSAGVAMTIRNI